MVSPRSNGWLRGSMYSAPQVRLTLESTHSTDSCADSDTEVIWNCAIQLVGIQVYPRNPSIAIGRNTVPTGKRSAIQPAGVVRPVSAISRVVELDKRRPVTCGRPRCIRSCRSGRRCSRKCGCWSGRRRSRKRCRRCHRRRGRGHQGWRAGRRGSGRLHRTFNQ